MEPHDPNIDARLRAVPLPEGLVERLCATALADDDGLDAALRELPAPAGLLDRLRSIPLGDDADLDAALRDVAIPARMEETLRAIPLGEDEDLDAALREIPLPTRMQKILRAIPLDDDEGLDAALRDVPVPVSLATPWQRRLRRRKQLVWLTQLAAAAAVLFAVFGWYGAFRRAEERGVPSPDLIMPSVAQKARPQDDKLQTSLAARAAAPADESRWHAVVPDVRLSRNDKGIAEKEPSLPQNVDPLKDIDLYRSPTPYGVERPLEELPEPKKAVGLVRRGIDWPLVPGSNYFFLARYGVHPFVSPAADPRLQSIVAPLGGDGSSFELTRRWLEEKELPPPDEVRTEDFLAAVNYDFPHPTQEALAITMAGGPSPFGGEGFWLLQVGVQAREIPRGPHPPVHLVFVVDASASMSWGGRIDMIRRALKEWSAGLSPGDRLSLVSFSDDARLLIQDVGREEIDQFAAAVRSLAAEGPTNVSAGLGKAYGVAEQESGKGRPAAGVVLFTDGMLDLSPESAQRVARRASAAAARGIPLHVVDLSQQNQGDAELASLAAAGRGAVHRAANADGVRWAIEEIATGQSQIVARDALLRMAFNPKAVLEYRLLGHEAKALAGLLPEHPQADFHAGQSATVLYELRLAPGVSSTAVQSAASTDIAQAELIWYDGDRPRPEGRRSAVERIGQKQFAAIFSQTAPSLQFASLVAEAAEILRRSPFVRTPRTAVAMSRVRDLSAQVDSRLSQRPAFVDFVALVEKAMKAKPAPPRGRRR